MSGFQFSADQISQHVVKLAIDVLPAVNMDQNRAGLQGFANRMIERFPDIFDTLVSGPNQFRVNRTFQVGQGRAEVATLVWSQRGPVITIPQRLFVNGSQDITGPEVDEVCLTALEELGERLPDRGTPRMSLIHNLVFDTDEQNSLDVVAENFAKPNWANAINNARIQMETVIEGRNVAYDIRPTYVSAGGRSSWPAPSDARFGVVVNVEMAIGNAPNQLETEEIKGLLMFGKYHVPTDLVTFLNGVS